VGLRPVLPSLAYAPAPFADRHAGTLTIRPDTLIALLVDIGAAAAERGITLLALVNAHFDPAQVGALRTVVERLQLSGGLRVVFPDLTRRRLADRLGEEFRSGACHAGRYESSILSPAGRSWSTMRRACSFRRCRSRSSRPRGGARRRSWTRVSTWPTAATPRRLRQRRVGRSSPSWAPSLPKKYVRK
jgi:creatinine amidohydrolase/Fe(II)-dependent formamide hydrolase-like protein